MNEIKIIDQMIKRFSGPIIPKRIPWPRTNHSSGIPYCIRIELARESNRMQHNMDLIKKHSDIIKDAARVCVKKITVPVEYKNEESSNNG